MAGKKDDIDTLLEDLGGEYPVGWLDEFLDTDRAGDPADRVEDVPAMLGMLAKIDAELEKAGAYKLLTDKEKLRDRIKKAMSQQGKDKAIDELSNWAAVLRPSFSDVWDPVKFKKATKEDQRQGCIVEVVDVKAVAELVEIGALSRARLEKAGAVTKRLRAVSLIAGLRKSKEPTE